MTDISTTKFIDLDLLSSYSDKLKEKLPGTYVGATSTSDAVTGTVPAATSSERSKFLRGDGTWVDVSGGEGTSYTAGDGIDISDDNVISTEVRIIDILQADYDALSDDEKNNSQVFYNITDATVEYATEWDEITDKPTTISGYGITDAKISSGTVTIGNNSITPLTSASTLDATKVSGTLPSSTYTDTTYVFNTTYNASTNKAATMSDITSAISGVTQFDYEIVTSLPSTGVKGKIYLVANSGSGSNVYDEYIYVNSKFELMGTTQIDISGKVDKTTTIAGVDLKDNITKAEMLTALNVEDGSEVNTIETVKVNGTALTPSSKAVDITVPTNNNQLTNGAGYITSSYHDSTKADTSSLATVAISGKYSDLTGTPTIPTVNNATLTIQKNGTNVQAFTANASSDVTANITVPTKTSELTNDSGYKTVDTTYSAGDGISISSDNTISTKTRIIDLTQAEYDAIATKDSSVFYNITDADADGEITESTISDWGFTKNTGTVTSVGVKMNGSVVDTVTTSGTIDLGTVITAHQDISGKMDKANPTGTGYFSLNRKADTAVGDYSFAEGYNTTASGERSHSEGSYTTASGNYSHAEGSYTTASGAFSHSEGRSTTASEGYSHAEGNNTTASGKQSHVEGYNTTASGTSSHAEGSYTTASSDYQHSQGKYNVEDTEGTYAHIVGNGSSDSNRSNAHTLDWSGNAWFAGDVTDGSGNTISGKMDKANPTGTGYFSLNRKADTAVGSYSFTEGYNTTASGNYSHAEGSGTVASGIYSHAEGSYTTASGNYSHAEGYYTASGIYSHAEGCGTKASGSYGSHAEGYYTTASGGYGSHTEGTDTIASGGGSHSEGYCTLASSDYQHVQGKYNVEDTEGTYAHIVGNGTSTDNRSNAHTLDWDGNAWFAGSIDLNHDKGLTFNSDVYTDKYGNLIFPNATASSNWNLQYGTGTRTIRLYPYSGNAVFSGTVKDGGNNILSSKPDLIYLGIMETDATSSSGTYKTITLKASGGRNYIILSFSNDNKRMCCYMVRVNGTNLYSLPILPETVGAPITISASGSQTLLITANSTAVSYVYAMLMPDGTTTNPWDDITITKSCD